MPITRKYKDGEIGRSAAETVESRHANDPKPSIHAPLAEQFSWIMDHIPEPFDIDKRLQDKYRARIKKYYENKPAPSQ